jgi:spore coat polysaccharide biosynthesis predicted glycosyltransferase SpsG/CMP-N-acetylneuraminic acid synthetase
MKNKNIFLIMARSGNEYLARQNLRLVNDKPLLFYILQTCLKFKNTDVYVTTDSEEISELSLMYGAKVIKRPKSLTKNSTSLEEIAFHALSNLSNKNLTFEKCILLSPQFLLIKTSTLEKFFRNLTNSISTIYGYINNFEKFKKINDPNKSFNKLHELDSHVVDIKKIVSFNCKNLLKNKKFNSNHYGLKLSKNETFSLLNYHDIGVLETIVKRKKILIRVDGNNEIGLGHIYNMLTILNHFRNDDLLIVMHSQKNMGSNKFKEHLYKLKFFSNQNQLSNIIKQYQPDIIFNDILDTSVKYMKFLKQFTNFIVNFEDLGSGNKHANLVFNPIYYSKKKSNNIFYGSRYAAVRDEFRIWQNDIINKQVKKVLITFGGSDPTNKTQKIIEILRNNNLKNIEFTIILGIGYSHKKSLNKLILKMRKNNFKLKINEGSDFLAKFFRETDFAITSNGRTVFELAAMNVPIITIPVNNREKTHSFVKYADVGFQIDPDSKNFETQFLDSFNKICSYKIRKKYKTQLKNLDLLEGINLVYNIINNKYEEFTKERHI